MKTIDKYMLILGSLIVVGFFGLIVSLMLVDVKESNQSLMYLVTGGLMGSFTSIVGYYFGSSQGSKIKTEMMNDNLKNVG